MPNLILGLLAFLLCPLYGSSSTENSMTPLLTAEPKEKPSKPALNSPSLSPRNSFSHSPKPIKQASSEKIKVKRLLCLTSSQSFSPEEEASPLSNLVEPRTSPVRRNRSKRSPSKGNSPKSKFDGLTIEELKLMKAERNLQYLAKKMSYAQAKLEYKELKYHLKRLQDAN